MDGNLRTRRSPASCVVIGGDRPIVRLSGRISRALAARAGSSIMRTIDGGERHLLVDVTAMIDCHGHLLTVLADAHRGLSVSGGSLTIVGARLAQFLPAMERAPLHELFLLYAALRAGPGEEYPVRVVESVRATR